MVSEKRFEVLRTLMAVIIALALAFVIVIFVSDEPIETLKVFLLGPFKSKRYMGNVIELFIPLAFAGLATSVFFQAELFNLGSEGIYYISGIVATIVALKFIDGGFMQGFLAIAVAALVGMVLGVIPGILKAKWDANVLVTSLMFNSIYFGIGFYILNYYLRDPILTEVASYRFAETTVLANLVPGTRIHIGLIIVLMMALLVYLFFYKTKWGYSLRMTGINSVFSKYIGIKTFWIIIIAHLIAGFIAGMGGAVEVLGMYNRFRWTALPGLGFDGALVAMLGKNKPFGTLGAALFLAYIRISADLMARLTNVPAEMVAIIQAVIILLISGERFLFYWRQRMLLKEAK
ncbi:ABC transporter permease [Vallitalea maricola]|uniref:ABC transporter permease n=1 Tax=Vallitalea maricola TaxID=3074433 RepID=A0ACB5UIG4_9FIRM|nr:ABC transporter permease [Vallitalea sp. AN17-2]